MWPCSDILTSDSALLLCIFPAGGFALRATHLHVGIHQKHVMVMKYTTFGLPIFFVHSSIYLLTAIYREKQNDVLRFIPNAYCF